MTNQFADISLLVRPRRVAVVGASDRPGSFGYSTFSNVHRSSHIPGGAVPVNPQYETVLGEACYARVSDIPGDPVDVVIVLVAANLVPGVVEDCAGSGVRHLVILTSGFSETDDTGKKLQADVVESARAAGMRVYGPNSPGLANIADRALLSMSPVAAEDVTSGAVGLVTQGGGLGRAVMQWMDRGLGIGLWCSPGNEADLDIGDFVNHMLDDDRIKVIGAVVEGFGAGPKFLAVAARAREIGKPIVILKIGRSEYGQKSAASHTASIAGNDAVTSAVFSQHGVVRVDDVDELGETLMLFSRALDAPDVGGICVYSFSGGTASLAADLVGAAGLTLAEFSTETRAAIDERAPAFGFADNPVDLTTRVFTDSDLNRAVLRLICADPAVGSVLFAMPADYGANTVDVTRDAIDIAGQTGTLLIPVWMSPRRGGGYQLLEDAGLAPFQSTRSAVTALRRLVEWRRGRSAPVSAAAGTGEAGRARSTSDQAMAYEDAARLLSAAGLRFPEESFEVDATGAAAAADRIGGPVALKLSAPGLIHKTEVGGVRLGIEGSASVAAAFDEMVDSERLATYGLRADGVHVQEMVDAGVDLLLSAHRDPVFGPVVTLGAGGVGTELEKDVLHLAIPFTRDQFDTALSALRLYPRLTGFRGGRGYDLEVLYRVAADLGAAFVSWRDATEVEVNPLRLIDGEDGTRAVALDAVVLRS